MYESITGGVLAGGRGARMSGQDKGLVILNQKALVQYSIEALQSIVGNVIISANRNLLEYKQFGFPVLTDNMPGFHGPLAGILRLMEATSSNYLLVMPCDCPLITKEHIEKLLLAIINLDVEISVANDGSRMQPVFAAMKTALAGELKNFLACGERKVETWVKSHQYCSVDFNTSPDIFLNVNSFQDLKKIKQILNV